MKIKALENRIRRAAGILITLSLAAIAMADFAVGPTISLGPLYLIPLCYSALTQRRAITIAVFCAALVLREVLGPIELNDDPWFVFGRDLVIAAIFVTVAMYLSRLGKQRHEFFELAREQRDELSTDVRLAVQLQARLLETNPVSSGRMDIFARTAPLKGVGGDYYDFLPWGPGHIGIVAADVAGKGLPAALLMPAVRIALRSIVQRFDDPRRAVAELDRAIYEATEPENYATLFFGKLDTATGELEYVNAGHLPGVLVDADGQTQWLGTGGPPVGLLPAAAYDSETVHIPPGGILVLYTDGITESESPAGEEYGREHLAEVVRSQAGKRSEEVVNGIRRDLLGHIDGGTLADDATAIAVRHLLPHEADGETSTEFIRPQDIES